MLSPTRELALQIKSVVVQFAEPITVPVQLLTGGTDPLTDIENFKEHGANILIATPGRLEDIFRRMPTLIGYIKDLALLILDEADRLLDLGFEKSINTILRYLPKQRRTGLFSATQTQQIQALVRAGLRNPVLVSVRVESKQDRSSSAQSTQSIPTSLDLKYVITPTQDKLGQLVSLIQWANRNGNVKIMVYLLTCACVDYFTRILAHFLEDVPILSLHGKIPAKFRPKTLEEFRNMASGVLVCTDVAARGLDIPDIDWVVQYDPPQDPAAFVHRCGRTARIGRAGRAVVFLLPSEDTYINFLKLRNIPIKEFADPLEPSATLESVRKLAASDREVSVAVTKYLTCVC